MNLLFCKAWDKAINAFMRTEFGRYLNEITRPLEEHERKIDEALLMRRVNVMRGQLQELEAFCEPRINQDYRGPKVPKPTTLPKPPPKGGA